MYVLGISCFFHDAAAVLLRDGVIVAAAEEERFSRKKHDYEFPSRAIDFCLQRAGIRGQDLHYVAFFEKPFLKFERLLFTVLANFPRSRRVFQESMITWLTDKLWIQSLIKERLGVSGDRVLFSEHHLSHAASAYLCMLYVVDIKPDKREVIPAITHVDGAGRLQTVRRETNPRYYRLIERFGQATGVPVVLNTSFDLKGEPIVKHAGPGLQHVQPQRNGHARARRLRRGQAGPPSRPGADGRRRTGMLTKGAASWPASGRSRTVSGSPGICWSSSGRASSGG